MTAPAGPSKASFDWNGDSGDRWVANQVRLDRMLEPFGQALLAAARPVAGERVLDVGCGAGTTSFQFGDAVGAGGSVLGVDISTALIDRARERAGSHRDQVAFQVGDAARMTVDAPCDLIVSRFGVMFLDEPVAAFANMRRALKPEGRLAFVCWRAAGENDWTRLPMGAVRDIVPPTPPADPEAPGPFSFGERARVEAILGHAGFVNVEISTFDSEILFGVGSDADAAVEDALQNAWEVGPLARALADQDDEVRQRAAAAVRSAFRRRLKPEGVVIDGAAWLVTATASARA